MHQCASQCRGCSCVGSLVRVCVLVLPALAFCDLSRSRPPLVLASTVRFKGTEGGKGGTCTQHYLGIIGAAHFSFTMEECFFRSNASRIASPSFNPFPDKSTSVSSGLSPQRVVSWGKLVAAWTIASAPLLPNSFLSRLQSRVWRHVCQTGLLSHF